jgi:hypothetical protein
MRVFRFFLVVMISSLFAGSADAQQISKADLKLLNRMDDSLGMYADKMLDAAVVSDRMRADSMFTRILVRALRTPYSFRYPFDSIPMIPILYAPDSSFRLLTWHLPMNDDSYRQKGTLQMNTADGSLKMFPLFDISDYSDALQDSMRGPQNWVGAVYYKIIQQEAHCKPVYTLLGYDENNELTSRKWIETLTFNERGEPQWGGDFFAIGKDSIFPAGSQRYLMEYKKEGRARLNYDDEDSLIIMDHLVSETNEPEKKFTLIPGGDYEGLKWKDGKWNYVEKLFMEVRGDGNEPKPMTILDDAGNYDEAALQKQTEKNIEKAKAAEKKKTPVKPPAKKKGD